MFKVKCPFHGGEINLLDCPIVATNVVMEEAPVPVSRTSTPTVHKTDLPTMRGVMYLPQLQPAPSSQQSSRSGLGRFKGARLPPLTEGTRVEDVPARMCPECKRALPRDIDECDVLTVALVGTQRTGKTTYITSMTNEGYRQNGFKPLGWGGFVPDEMTARLYHDRYYVPLYETGTLLGGTAAEGSFVTPLTFKVTNGRGHSSLLMMHDLPGEALAEPARRAEIAPFLHWADAVIFLWDPRALLQVKSRLAAQGVLVDTEHQTDLLHTVLSSIGERLRDVPIIFVCNKADLLETTYPDAFPFTAPVAESRDEWLGQLDDISLFMKAFLESHGAADVVAAVERAPRHAFLAVSPLGHQPSGGVPVMVNSQRCLDPVLAALSSLPRGTFSI